MKFFTKLKNIIKSSYLCIRFPFFYPRNRFTGYHYNNWDLIKLQRKYREQYASIMSVHLCNKKYIDVMKNENTTFTKSINTDGYNFVVRLTSNGIIVETYNDTKHTSITCIPKEKFMKSVMADESDVLHNGKIIDVYFEVSKRTKKYPLYTKEQEDKYSYTICVVVDYPATDDKPSIEYKTFTDIIKDNLAKYISSFYKYVERFIGFFHIIPTYTELNGMPKGWRKAFGIKMFSEIKHSLLHTYIREENVSIKTPIKYIKAYWNGIKLLYDFRITDIKEKFSSLCVYVERAPMDVYEIIDKYDRISYNTCIICGKPAVWRTTGWICPYCDYCLSDDKKITAKRIEVKQ